MLTLLSILSSKQVGKWDNFCANCGAVLTEPQVGGYAFLSPASRAAKIRFGDWRRIGQGGVRKAFKIGRVNL